VAFTAFSIFYGFAFAILGQVFLIQLTAPLVLLAALVFWVAPDTESPPNKLLIKLFFAYLLALLCWPDYIALALPGVPWITAIRLTSYPLLITFFLCLSSSKDFRRRVKDICLTSRLPFYLVMAFTVIAALSVGLSRNPVYSINRLIVFGSTCTLSYFVGCYIFSQPGRIEQFVRCLIGIMAFCLVVGLYEARYSKLPWAGRIPSFLAVQDENIIALLNGTARAFVGAYRVQSKFSTALSFGEFIGLSLPFIMHYAVRSPTIAWRWAGCLVVVVAFYIVLKTDSRLAVGSYFASVLLYGFYWAFTNWRNNRQSVLPPMFILAYPGLMAAFFVLSIVWHRLEVLVWGGPASQSSTDARKLMIDMGIPKIMHNPIGHGVGMGSETLGYFTPGGRATIDIYYLNAALEFGVVGVAIFTAIFALAAVQSAVVGLKAKEPELTYGVPACIALINFMISKTVLAQQENHPLAFLIVGMVSALAFRDRQSLSLPAFGRPQPKAVRLGFSNYA
jgi:hypothetical protein